MILTQQKTSKQVSLLYDSQSAQAISANLDSFFRIVRANSLSELVETEAHSQSSIVVADDSLLSAKTASDDEALLIWEGRILPITRFPAQHGETECVTYEEATCGLFALWLRQKIETFELREELSEVRRELFDRSVQINGDLADELHDGVMQELAGLSFHASSTNVETGIADLRSGLHGLAKGLRRILVAKTKLDMNSLDLSSAVDRLSTALRTESMPVEFSDDRLDTRSGRARRRVIDRELAPYIYHFIRDAVEIVALAGEASRVEINLRHGSNWQAAVTLIGEEFRNTAIRMARNARYWRHIAAHINAGVKLRETSCNVTLELSAQPSQ